MRPPCVLAKAAISVGPFLSLSDWQRAVLRKHGLEFNAGVFTQNEYVNSSSCREVFLWFMRVLRGIKSVVQRMLNRGLQLGIKLQLALYLIEQDTSCDVQSLFLPGDIRSGHRHGWTLEFAQGLFWPAYFLRLRPVLSEPVFFRFLDLFIQFFDGGLNRALANDSCASRFYFSFSCSK